MMKLLIWVSDIAMSPDMDETIYTHLELRFDKPLDEMQKLALELAHHATWIGNAKIELKPPRSVTPLDQSVTNYSIPDP